MAKKRVFLTEHDEIMNDKCYTYKTRLVRTVDGDTFDAKCDAGFGNTATQRFRLKGIDTPETTWRASGEDELEHGEKATQLCDELLKLYPYFYLKSSAKSVVYGRFEAEVTLLDGRDLAEALREAGMCKKHIYPDVDTEALNQ